MFAVNCRPGSGTPTISGETTALGAKCCLSTTGKVWFVMAVSLPARFEPVIQTRSEKPMSATVGVYVAAVAPMIGTHVPKSPTGLQRRHEYVNAIGVEPSQTPAVSVNGVSTTVCCGGPGVIVGVVRAFTAIAIVGAVTSEFCDVRPSELEAVTATRKRQPKSAGTGV